MPRSSPPRRGSEGYGLLCLCRFSGTLPGGSGKRQLADGACTGLKTIGKLRGLRLPLPPDYQNIFTDTAC